MNRRLPGKQWSFRRIGWLMVGLCLFGLAVPAEAQPLRCDPAKINTAESCARCHGAEVVQWKATAHYQTFESLVRNPRAKEITDRLGLTSVKRNEICTSCHFTLRAEADGQIRPIAGISCESCHGPSVDWIAVHNDYGGPRATRETESEEHARERLRISMELGMNNTRNLYAIARSCLNCHTVPHERLVNVGGHVAGSSEFELVAWSQGRVRHNFLRSDGQRNEVASPQRLRVMYVTGMLADLEFSTRATALATEKAIYGTTVAQRAADVAGRLFELNQQLNNESVQRALEAFAEAELSTGNASQLLRIADRIQQAGMEFAAHANGEELGAVDAWLPRPEQYKH